MSEKSVRSLWVVIILAIAALFLYMSLARRPAKPQPQDEFPVETSPPST